VFSYVFIYKLYVGVAVYYEGLQDKLTQVKDARAALDALREEHREKLRRQAEEAERIRQLQMAHKLEIMRKKKQEYLQVSVRCAKFLTCRPITYFFFLIFHTVLR
jgi:GTP1/Obg family GTP-binding protein